MAWLPVTTGNFGDIRHYRVAPPNVATLAVLYNSWFMLSKVNADSEAESTRRRSGSRRRQRNQ